MRSDKLSFEEKIHQGVLKADGPAQALNEASAAIESEIALAGTLFYSFAEPGRMVVRGGSLTSLFSGDVSWLEDDPCQDRACDVHLPLVHATRLLPRSELRVSNAYRHFYGKYNIDHVVCLRLNGLQHSTPGMIGLFLGRSGDHGDFAGTHKRRLLAMLPMLTALHRAKEFEAKLRSMLDGLATAIDSDQAIFVASREGEFLWCSELTRALLAATPQTLIADLGKQMLDRTTETTGSRARTKALAVRLGVTRDVWSMELTHFPHRGQDPLYFGRFRPTREAEAEVGERYQLTPTEGAVLACLGEGMSNIEVGEALSMSSSTAATHVKRVLAKMGVDSRLQAGLIMQRAQLSCDAGRKWQG